MALFGDGCKSGSLMTDKPVALGFPIEVSYFLSSEEKEIPEKNPRSKTSRHSRSNFLHMNFVFFFYKDQFTMSSVNYL